MSKRTAAIVIILASGWMALAATEMSVQTRTAQVRSTPSFLGAVVAPLEYGARVKVLEERGDWVRVEAPGGSVGWVHRSALTPKRIVLAAGDTPVTVRATGEELALAGKGFSKEVETEYRARNPSVDFTWVDRMETLQIPLEEIFAFFREGGLRAGGGSR